MEESEKERINKIMDEVYSKHSAKLTSTNAFNENSITFNNNQDWVMRITPDRRIEVNEDIELTEIVKTVFAGIQDLLDQSEKYK